MATYRAPINDMMFLFEKLRDNSHYNEIEKYKEVNADNCCERYIRTSSEVN